jgi:cytochrome c-type biogenesis protein CcmF
MDYIGEHLLPGQIGHFLVVLSLVSSLVAMIAYCKAAQATLPDDISRWKRLARIAFITDALSVFVIFSIILLIISNHYFEYYYAWNHSDKSLAPKYLLSSIWEGQEGSFLLWTFWHAVLGLILMRTAKKWEAPVLTVISFAQVCLATMILGVYVFDVKIGSTPFMLTRQITPAVMPADYLSLPKMQDGNGLNQLLQNYWMVIHPPVLFLGFASTIVPFAFAIAGLWKKDFGGWIKAALPWSLFSAGILGTGIMMGAMWAYESLTFGGYWAWDPVENASLVPWLVLVAGVHTQLVYNATGHSLRATYLFFILSFLLILYSTYLTRSGDLQDTSVHAFVDSGMNWQLRVFVFVFVIPSLILFIARYKKIPHIVKEENTWSREFWMFIGSLVLFLSAMAIIVPTSFPIFNKLFGTGWVIGEDREFPYNRIQIFVAVVLGVLTAVTQYFKYKNTSKSYVGKKIWLPTVLALLLSVSISIWGGIDYDKYGLGYLAAIHLALFAAIYAVVANTGYIWAGLKGKVAAAGASVGHLGFGLLLVGILISSSKKEVLSVNTLNPLNFGPEAKNEGLENLTMFTGVRTDMGAYWATYVRDSVTEKGKMNYFRIDMERKDGKDRFTLYPNLVKNTKGGEGFSGNPDSKHYWHKDIFSYVNYSSRLQEPTDTSKFKSHTVQMGDTIYYSEGFMTLDSVTVNPRNDKYQFAPGDTAIMANLNVVTKDNRKITARPVFYVHDGRSEYIYDTLFSQGLAIGFTRIADQQHIEITVKESSKLAPFIALKVLKFPFINLVWLGTLIMVIGFAMAVVRRIKLSREPVSRQAREPIEKRVELEKV